MPSRVRASSRLAGNAGAAQSIWGAGEMGERVEREERMQGEGTGIAAKRHARRPRQGERGARTVVELEHADGGQLPRDGAVLAVDVDLCRVDCHIGPLLPLLLEHARPQLLREEEVPRARDVEHVMSRWIGRVEAARAPARDVRALVHLSQTDRPERGTATGARVATATARVGWSRYSGTR